MAISDGAWCGSAEPIIMPLIMPAAQLRDRSAAPREAGPLVASCGAPRRWPPLPSRQQFAAEVEIALRCIAEATPEQSGQLATSYGMTGTITASARPL
jgi:hypothetical protein